MQFQFHKTELPCLQRVKGEILTQEQTQELRITEEMPDIGTVLGAWGQVLVRGKEWRRGGMELSCGVMVWAMYRPEEGGNPQIVEGWLPFQFKWDLPETEQDGTMTVSCFLHSVDARVTSARKLMLRATLGVLGEAWVPMEGELHSPEGIPEDVYLLKKTYPLWIPREAGEKTFSLDEELTLPASAPRLARLLRFSLQPEMTDQKVMAGKVVFRGAALLHILYSSDDGSLCCWDFELPFSQYSELKQEYDQGADARLSLCVTGLELDADAEGRLRLKAGLTGQYCITDRCNVELVEDAYSPYRSVEVHRERLELPMILEELSPMVVAQQPVAGELGRVADLAFYPDQPRQNQNGDTVNVELSGYFQMLSYDPNGDLQGTSPKWHGTWSIPAHPDSCVNLHLAASGIPQMVTGGEPAVRGDLLMHVQTMDTQGLSMVTALELGEHKEPEPKRPSLILRRVRNDSLWELAKSCGSTVDAIREANRLQDEPRENQMLLIPVL